MSLGVSQRRPVREVSGIRALHYFEFIVLEVALENVCSLLASQTDELEEDAYPALDSLTTKVTSAKLERIRQVKARMTRLLTRVQQVEAELEHLLDNDDDMHEMYALLLYSAPPLRMTRSSRSVRRFKWM